MGKNKLIHASGKHFLFHRLSLRQRLPLLIGVLLLSTIITFSWISYIGVKSASLKSGKERLATLAGQVSSMFSQSAQAILTYSRATASREPIIKYLKGNTGMQGQAQDTIKKLRTDSTWILVELLGPNRQTVLRSARDSIQPGVNFDSLLQRSIRSDSVAYISKFYLLGNSIYYAIIVPIVDNKQLIGYLVRWRLQTVTPKSLEQLSQLMGTGARLYFGNVDGSLWTDLIKPVPFQQLDSVHLGELFEYKDQEGKEVIVAAQPIGNTPWLVSISFSRKIVLETAKRFLRWVVFIGMVLIAVGIFTGWLLSRSITGPLNKLTVAALAISRGDYSSPVGVERNDELGTLAAAFNSMAIQVRNAKEDLEKKVIDRTMQLETVNRELESFSYSVSHDLRAPLRAIIGFTTILKEDYTGKLDEEAMRITTVIKENTIKMGQLIDDLLAFSRMGRQDINKTNINMDDLVKNVINELTRENKMGHIKWIVQPLPVVKGDLNLIRQVWVNLISNAIKYSRNRERPEIEIGTFEIISQTVYFIKDNGSGFDEKYMDKLFKVFQRLHSNEEFEGTGIGLALVEKIISKHAGNVWAESVMDEGATFYFSLPK